MTASILPTSFGNFRLPEGPLPDEALSYLEQHLGDGDIRELPLFHVLADGLALSPRSRLAMRAQPSLSIITNNPNHWAWTIAYHSGRDYGDISSEFLQVNMVRCLLAGILEDDHVVAFHNLFGNEDDEYCIDVLTCLDAYADLPSGSISTRMSECMVVISKLASEAFVAQRSLWQDAMEKPSPPNRETRISFCLTWTLNARLVFYCNRMAGQTMEEYSIELERLREQSGIPSDWIFRNELKKLQSELSAEHESLQRDFESLHPDAQLKWDGEPIDVCEVSTPASADDMADSDCIICYNNPTPLAVVTKPCGHLYCQGCLATWIHACQRQSHTCPACRTELFPKPNYVLDGTEALQERQAIERVEFDLGQLAELLESWNWLKEELSLQKRYERDYR